MSAQNDSMDRSRIFMGGGGVQKIMWAHAMHITSAKPRVPYGRGPGMETLGVFDALSFYASIIFKHNSNAKLDIKKPPDKHVLDPP